MLSVKLIEQRHEKTMTATAFELRADGHVDLGRKPLIFPLELLDQVFVQRYGHFALGRRHTPSVPE